MKCRTFYPFTVTLTFILLADAFIRSHSLSFFFPLSFLSVSLLRLKRRQRKEKNPPEKSFTSERSQAPTLETPSFLINVTWINTSFTTSTLFNISPQTSPCERERNYGKERVKKKQDKRNEKNNGTYSDTTRYSTLLYSSGWRLKSLTLMHSQVQTRSHPGRTTPLTALQ